MDIIQEISELLQKGRAPKVKELVEQAVSEGVPAEKILSEGLLAGMGIVGDKFRKNEVFVPEVLVAARAMNFGVEALKPYLQAEGVKGRGTVVIGTVKGDLHDIGKNLVKLMIEGRGITVHDLGTDVSPETFVEKAKEYNADIICCSALLTTTMNEMQNVVAEAEKAGIRDKVKIFIGGAPITQEFCDKIGADCYTCDAASAAIEAEKVCCEKNV